MEILVFIHFAAYIALACFAAKACVEQKDFSSNDVLMLGLGAVPVLTETLLALIVYQLWRTKREM